MNVSTNTVSNNSATLNALFIQKGKPSFLRWFFICMLFLTAGANVNAQSLANYTFGSSTTASLTDMTSGTTPLVGLETGTYRASVASAVTSMPFPFLFMGALQTQFSCNSNGQMRFGSTVIGTSVTVPSAGISYLCPMAGANATSATGVVHYKVTGSYPSRVMTIAWDSLLIPANSTAGIIGGTVQARLYEGTGVVEFVYGKVYNNSATAQTRSIFLGSSNTATTNGYVTVGATPTFTLAATNVTNSFAGGPSYIANLSGATDGNRIMYSFTPTTTHLGPSSLSFANVTTTSMTLNWTVPGVTTGILGYAILASTDGGVTYNVINSVTGAATATINLTGLTPNTSYLWSVYSYNEGALSTTSASGPQATNACSISGTKSVGPSAADYVSLTAALADIKLNGITGPVILELQSTYVSTVETFPIALNAVPCASAINTITIRPGATGLSITSTNTTATMNIDGGNYYIIDGRVGGTGSTKDLVISNTSVATGGTAIRFINEASNNVVKYSKLKSTFASTSFGVVFFSTTTGVNGNDNNTIDNNDIDGGAGATASPVNVSAVTGIFALGSTTTIAQQNSGIIISNNNIFDYFNTGATSTSQGLHVSTGNTDWTITGNSFYQTATRTSTVGAATLFGIRISNAAQGNNFTVTNNFVGGSAASAGGTALTMTGAFANLFQGIALAVGTTTASNVQGNTVKNMSWGTNSTSSTAPGVWAGMNVAGAVNVGTSSANTIGSGTGTGSITITAGASAGLSCGISSASTGAVDISNNIIGSINAAGSTASFTHSFAGIWINGVATAMNVNNNTIGSTSTANSINMITAGTGTTAGVITGILQAAAITTVAKITNNTIANLNSAYVPTAANTNTFVRGIWAQSGRDSIAGNTVRNLSTAGNGSGTSSGASVIGIGNFSSTAGANYIRANTVHSLSNTNATNIVYVTGIYYFGPSTGGIIDRNLVHSLTSTSVVSQVNGIHAGGSTATYQNNMIRLGSDAAGAAIITSTGFNGILETAGANNFYHNTVMIEGAGVNSVAANTYAFNNNVLLTAARDIRNNIFINNRNNAAAGGKHYAVRVGGTTTLPTGLTLNYNIYRATGANGGTFGFYNSLDVASLAAWQTAVGLDANSLASNPCIISQTGIAPDLHLTDCAGAGSPADGTGVSLGVADDYDAQTRSLLTPTDIGADAGNYGIIGVDVGISALVTPAAVTGCLTATEAVTVTLTNYGVNTIDFSLNPVTITVTATGGYSSTKIINSGIPLVSNGTQNELMPDAINMTVNGTYVFTSTATVTGDVQNANNSNITNRVVSGLGGTYSVGAGQAPAGFNTLTAAVAAYNAATCISGPVTFNLVDLNYSTSETFPIIVNANANAGTNTLTIKPAAAGTVITGAVASNSLLRLNAADYVIIDGSTSAGTDQSLTITNTSTSTPTAISMVSLGTALGATNNTIKNCIITTGSSAVASYGISVGGTTPGSAGSDNDNNTIQNNAISAVANGISALGNASVSATGMDNLSVIGNTITTSTSIATLGIRVGNGLNSSVSRNTISVEQTSTGAPLGISIETGFVSSSVTRNNITKAKAITTGGYGGRGITIGTASATSNLTIANNFISGVTGDNWTTFGNASSMGICIGAIGAATTLTTVAGGLNIYHNTVNMYDTYDAARAAITTAIFIGTGASAVDLRNNIFVNTMNNTNVSGTGSKAYAIYSEAANTVFSNINYNNYSVSGSQGVLGFLTSDRTTFNALQTAFGGNANSSNIAPVFTSSSNLHMNINSNPTLENTGAALAAVTNDYDNDSRSATTPDMGADEWSSPVGIDMGATALVSPNTSGCYTATETVTITVKNHSNNTTVNFTTDPVTLTVTATGGYSQTVLIDGVNYGPVTLAPQATANITLPVAIDMSVPGAFTFNAATSIPAPGPGGADINATNNAMAAVTRTAVAPLAGTVTSNPLNGYCVTTGTPTLTLSSITGANTIQWQESTTSVSGPWTNVGTNSLTYTPASAITVTTYYQAIVSCGANTATSNVATVTYSNPAVLTTLDGSRCGTGTVQLCATVSAGSTVNWYSTPTGGTPYSLPYAAVPVTGFNNDIVATGVGTSTIVGTTYPAIGVDGQLYSLIDNTFQYVNTNALPTCFMPTNNLAPSLITAGLTYQLASYTAPNALTITNPSTTYTTNPLPSSGTLTLTTPASFANLKVLYESVVNVSPMTVNAVVTFSDATTQTFNGNSCVNWFTAGTTAFRGMGRTSPTGSIECGTTPNFFPNLFELSLPISPSNYSKLVSSITFSIPTQLTTGTTAASVNYFHAMAVGGNAPMPTCFTTPVISTTTPFYVAALSGTGGSTTTGLAVPPSGASSGAGTTNFGLVFDAITPFTIQTVTIYPVSASSSAGTVTIDVINGAGTVLHTTTVNVTGSPSGTPVPQVVNLNFNIAPGTNYKMRPGFTGITGLLFGQAALAPGGNYGYPFIVPGVLSITTSTLTAAPANTASPDLYYYFFNWVISSGCESPRQTVTATVTTPPPLTSATATPATICLGQTSTLNATSANPNYTYVWTPGNLANGATVTPTTTTTYTVTATDNITNPASPCVVSDVATVTVNPVPVPVTMSPTAATVCVGGSVSLSASSGQSVTQTFGAGATTLSTTGSPYRAGAATDIKTQVLILASELTTAGYQAGNITAIGFTTTSTSGTVINFAIKMGHTATSSFTTTFETPSTTVFTQASFTPVLGLNTHTFQTPFNWNGTSNIVVEVCQSNSISGTSIVAADVTAFNSDLNTGISAACGVATGATIATRPVITITANSASPITWSPGTDLNTTSGNTVISTPTSSPITYTATATLGSCTKTNTVTVTQSTLAVSAAHTNVLCNGGSTGTITATATGGTPGYTYSINGTTFQASNVFNVATGTYTIYVKDNAVPANCTVTGNTMVVTQPLVLVNTITASTDPTCNSSSPAPLNTDGSVTAVASGGTGPYTYTIAGPTVNITGATTGVFTGLTAGSYTVTATDFNGCTAISTAEVLDNPAAPAVSAANNGPICATTNATLTATPGTYASYAWTGPGIINNAGTAVATAVTPANNDVFTVLITDALGCTNTATTTVTVVANAAVSVSLGVSPNTEVCAATTVTFTATPTNGGATPNYEFFINAVSVQNGTSATYITTTLNDQDVVTVVMTSSITCTTGSPATSNAITMTVASNVFADVTLAASPATTVCSGTIVTYTATPTAGGPVPDYEFYVNNISVQNSTSATYSYVPANGDQIYVIMTSDFDCALGSPATSATIAMTVNPTPAAPTVTAGGVTTFCNGGSVSLTSNYTGAGNQWYRDNILLPLETNNNIVVTTSGSYTVVYTLGICPSAASAATLVTVNANPTATITGIPSFCTGGSTTLSAATSTAGSGTITSYQWVLNGTTNLGTAVTEVVSTIGSYTVIVTNSNGCSTTSAATVIVGYAPPTASITGDNQLCTGTSSTLNASASTAGSGTIITYQWVLNGTTNVGTNSITYTTNVAGSYTVIVTNSNGCSTTSAAFVVNPVPTAPLSGTYTINSTLPVSCTNYLSFATAIGDLNTRGVSANVLFNVNSGHTETAPVGGLVVNYCALGAAIRPSATQTVTFQGGTTSAVITAAVGTSTTVDGIVKLVGSDWITFDKVNLQESAANTTPTTQMEWGYALLKCDGNNGSNNNTISNCSITLNKANTASVGIYSGNHIATLTTALIYSGTAGNFAQVDSSRNGRNTFRSNLIQNVYGAFSMNGNSASSAPHSLNDTLNFIGISGQGNTITNFGGALTTVNVIIETNQRGFRVNSNSITGGTGSTGAVTGISMVSGVWGEVINNTLALSSSSTTSTTTGITCGFSGGDATNPNLVTITGNTVQNFINPASTSSIFTAITSSAGGTGSIINFSNNTVQNNTLLGTGAFNAITNSGGTTVTMNNNIIQNNSNSSTGTFTALGNTASATTLTMNGNNISGNTKGSTGTWTGLSFGTPTNATINNNTVYNNTVTGGGAAVTMNCTIGSTAIYTFSGNTMRKNRVLLMSGASAATISGYTNSGGPTNETITNNLIDSLWVTGAATPSTGIQIVRGIQNNTTSAVGAIRVVSGNTIRDLYTSSNISGGITGIISTIGNTVNIFKNKIYNLFPGQNGTSAAFAKGITNTSATSPSIYNNYIGLDLTGASAATGGLAANAVLSTNDAVKGIEITAGTTVKIYNNTIRLAGSGTGTAFGSSGIGLTSTTPATDIRNNIVENLMPGGGLAAANISVGLRRTATVTANATGYAATSNNNIWYINGANTSFYYDGTTSYPTFGGFQAQVTGRETNSKTENVTFISTNGPDATFLHVDAVAPTYVESGAQSIATVTDDYDGDTRNASTPDIGADEINGTAVPCSGATGGLIAFPNARKTVCSANTATTFAPVGYSTGGGITYQWMESATSSPTGSGYTTNVTGGTGGTTPIYTTAANLAPGTYYYILKVTCSFGGVAFANEDTVIVNQNPTASAANNGPLCSGASLTLTGTTNTGTSFAWSGPNGFTSTLQSPTFNAPLNGSGNYIFTSTFNGCTSAPATTAVVVTNTPPPFTINPPVSVFCEGGSTTLTAGGVSGTFSIGTQTTTETANHPYRTGLGNASKHQFLYLGSELTTAGLSPGNITALGFTITTLGTGTLANYTIKMSNVTAAALTSTYLVPGSSTTVYSSATFSYALGLNTYTFSTPFTWDGTSDVLVEICYDNTVIGGSGVVAATTPATIRNVGSLGVVNACSLTTGTTGTNRPLIQFTVDVTPSNVTWSPATGLNTTTGTVVIASPIIPTTYTATSTNGSCTSSATAQVLVNPLPSGATVSGTTSVCQGVTSPLITFSANVGTAPYTFTYTINGGSPLTVTTPSGSNPQSVTVSVPTGTTGTFIYALTNVADVYCTNTATGSATVTVNPLPTAPTGTDVTVCYDALPHTGSATAPSGSSVVWYTASTGGSLTTAPSGTAAGTYTAYAASKNDITGCESATRTLVTVTINALPVVSFSGLAGPYCTTDAAVTLTGSPVGGTFSGPGITGNSFDPATAGAGVHTITYTYSNGTCSNTATQNVTVNVCATGVTVNLKLFLQGYYIDGGIMQSVLLNQAAGASATETDNVTIELHDATTFALIESQPALLMTNGLASASFTTTTGSYYIAVKHRNTLQTWTANPVSCTASTPLYDFSNAITKAFGDNQVLLQTGIWGMMTGDLNQDDYIDGNDFPQYDFESASGGLYDGTYTVTDMNGDGFVDGNDFPVYDGNSSISASAIYPQ